MKTAEQTIFEMLIENTGCAMCDSGDHYGRHWQENQGKTLEDFRREPDVTRDGGCFTISLFHHLCRNLDTDELCDRFNEANHKAKNWNDDRFYGVSSEAGKVLDEIGLQYPMTINSSGNSYNGDSFLSQVIQYQYIELDGNDYILLQIHGGCDVRGGYTDAKMFYLKEDCYLDPCGTVYGVRRMTPEEKAALNTPLIPGCPETITRQYCSTSYDGYRMRWDSNNVELTEDELELCDYSAG